MKHSLRLFGKCFLLFRGISRVQVRSGFYDVRQLCVRTTGVCRRRRGRHDYVWAAALTAVTDNDASRRHNRGRGTRIYVVGRPVRRFHVCRATTLLLLLPVSLQQGHRSLDIVVVGRVVNGAVRPSICTLFWYVTDCSHRTVTWNGFMFLSLTRTGSCSESILSVRPTRRNLKLTFQFLIRSTIFFSFIYF